MTLTELIVAALAVWEILEIWHHGQITARGRAWMEAIDHWFVSRLAACMFCLAPWVSGLLVVPGLIVSTHVIWSWPWYVGWPLGLLSCTAKAVIYALAVARLANLGNDLCYDYARTPKEEVFVPVASVVPEEPQKALLEEEQHGDVAARAASSAWEVTD